MFGDLVQIHHSEYQEDIPFWKSIAAGNEPTLEIGCGHGRVMIPLLEAGLKVTGVDIDGQSLQFLENILNQRSENLNKRAEILEVDIFTYQTGKCYGSVIIPCNTFSTFQSSQRPELLKKIYGWLNPKGVFAASMPNPVNLRLLHDQLVTGVEVDQEIETTLTHPETGHPVQISSKFHVLGDALGWDWIYDHLLPDGNVERSVHSAVHDLGSLERYLNELSEAEFDEVRIQGDFQGGMYSPDSPYLILICRK